MNFWFSRKSFIVNTFSWNGVTLGEITRVGVSFESDLLEEFDDLIQQKGYRNRSEAIRDLVREFISEEVLTEDEDGEVAGAITIVYEHDASNVMEKIVNIQHHSSVSISGTTHVHLDEDNCLEVIVAQGKNKDLENLADSLRSLKGVKYEGESMFTR